MDDKKIDKTEKMCEVIKKQKTNKFKGKMIINFSNGTPSAIEKVIFKKGHPMKTTIVSNKKY